MPIDYLAKRRRAVVDTECFPNLWSIGFRDVESKKVVKLIRTESVELDRPRIAKILRNYRIHTFNGIGYDLLMIAFAMTGATCEELKEANDDIIPPAGSGRYGLKHWEFYEKYNCRLPDYLDHTDLMPIMPSAAAYASLKKYGGMMHSRTLMEFGAHFNKHLTDDEIEQSLIYLENDLELTEDALLEMMPQLDIRDKISVAIGVDVRSMSNAQIGEAIMRQYVEKRRGGKKLYKPDIVPGNFKYEAPAYVEFQTPNMQNMLSRLLRSNFLVKRDGYVQLPDMFGAKKKKSRDIVVEDEDDEIEGGSEIRFNDLVCKMGIGGLHSQEKNVSYFEDDDFVIVDVDVTGYYPTLMLRSGMEPTNMRGHFLAALKQIVDERVIAKRAGDKDKAEQGKIASNGIFGKTGSPYSIVYAPKMMIQTTVTGQLSLLMLIEQFYLMGWQPISANTDGVVTRVPRAQLGLFNLAVFDWECTTGLSMEHTYYRSIHSISVNSYMALKKKQDKSGKFTGEIEVKRKSAFAESGRGQPAQFGLKKTPMDEICYDAAIAYVLDGTPVESTVRNCQDIRKFVSVRAVKGGAEKDGEPVGKVVRYYYSDSSTGPLRYIESGNRVPNSEGAEPLLTLPDELPDDIDYARYEREAYAILDEAGLDVIDPYVVGRKGFYLGRQESQKTIHQIKASTATALCGAERKSRRDLWVEYSELPQARAGMKPAFRFCAKCRKEGEF